MAKYLFKLDRLGFKAGRVIDESLLKAGVLSTLKAYGVITEVVDTPKKKPNGNKLDTPANGSTRRSASKPKRNKGSS